MTTINIGGHRTTSYVVSGSDNTYVVKLHASINYAGSGAFLESAGFSNNKILVDGAVTGGDVWLESAFSLSGTGTKITISKTGTVAGYIGVDFHGTGQTITNHGVITAHAYGIYLTHETRIVNTGTITGVFGIVAENERADIVNGSKGRISATADGSAVELYGNAGVNSMLVNHGRITSQTGLAIAAKDGNDHIINDGVMKGGINLSGGNDIFDNRGGHIDHRVIGGLGGDTLIVNSASTRFAEHAAGGTDTVKSTVAYTLSNNVERLFLIGHNNVNAVGNAGDNTLSGNSGDNRLTGKGGADVFLFLTGLGHDVVADFANGSDHIDLSGWKAIIDFQDLKAHHLTVSGDNIIIHAGHDQLTLLDVSKAELDFQDFYF